ncbi:MAG: SUMF1/EgtB/PvdO family nonheme iron enzyme [Pseudomonadota bacterium]
MRPLIPLLACTLGCSSGRVTEAPPGMVFVPGGTYTVGSGEAQEGVVHTVTLEGFFIDRFPVTEDRVLAFAADPAAQGLLEGRRMGAERRGEESLSPAVAMTWLEAEAFARWAGRRLPTEAEWEAAARGSDARRYPWGDSYDPGALDRAAHGPNPVGQHPAGASPFGAEDMVGNVFQWTSSRTALSGQGGGPERTDPVLQVLKAGGWGRMERYNRATFRTALNASVRSPYIGLRTVLPAHAEPDVNLAAGLDVDPFSTARFEASEALRQILSFELLPGRGLSPVLARHLGELQPGTMVADVGAGVGFLTFQLSEAVGPEGKVYAVDVDESVLEFVDATVALGGHDNVKTVLSEPADITLPPESVDEVWLLGTLHCLSPDTWEAFIASCRSALRPGGLLVVHDSNDYELVATIGQNLEAQGFATVATGGDTRTWRGEGSKDKPRGMQNQGRGDVEAVLRKVE